MPQQTPGSFPDHEEGEEDSDGSGGTDRIVGVLRRLVAAMDRATSLAAYTTHEVIEALRAEREIPESIELEVALAIAHDGVLKELAADFPELGPAVRDTVCDLASWWAGVIIGCDAQRTVQPLGERGLDPRERVAAFDALADALDSVVRLLRTHRNPPAD